MPGGGAPDLARAEREARLAARLNHPHVVAVFDLVTDDSDDRWLVMEYVESRNLAQLVRAEGPLAPARPPGSARPRPPTPSPPRTPPGSCTATSSRPTSWSPPRAR